MGAGPGVRAGLAMPGPVCFNFPLGLMMASGMKVAERGQSSRDTGPGWGMSSYSVQRGGEEGGEQLQVRAREAWSLTQARLHLIDNSFPRGSARPGPACPEQSGRVRRAARRARAQSGARLSCPESAHRDLAVITLTQVSVSRDVVITMITCVLQGTWSPPPAP